MFINILLGKVNKLISRGVSIANLHFPYHQNIDFRVERLVISRLTLKTEFVFNMIHIYQHLIR